MDKNRLLESLILELLAEDDERFESIYYYVNNRPYKNMKVDCSPLYNKLEDVYLRDDIYSPTEVLNCLRKLLISNYIACYQFEDNKLLKINASEFKDFSKFNTHWFRITNKGKERLWRIKTER